MKYLFFKKAILAITISSLVFGGLGNVFTVNKALAQQGPTTPGEAVGQAIAKGTACFLAFQLEDFLLGAKASLIAPSVAGTAQAALFPFAIPSVGVNAAGETAKIQTSDALSKSKDCVRDIVVKMILDWVVDETVTWIQGGGQPRYVTNWGTFLQDAFNVGVGEIINETSLAFLCKPFGLQLRLTLLPVDRFRNRISCTLDDIVANIQDFYNDFEKGGWIAYNEVWQPENNYYGQVAMTHDEMLAEGLRKKEAAQNEALAGRGFLSVKQCLQRDATGKCVKEEIVTPGDIVGAATAKAVTSDIDWAANVHSWVASLVNATINRVIKEGLGLMRTSSASQPANYGGDYNPYGSYDPAISGKQQDINRIKNDFQTYLAYFNAILANKQSGLSSSQQILTALNEIKTRNCQPPVSDTDITTAQNEVTRLTNEVSTYQTIVNEAQAGITEANNISPNFRDREVALLEQHYNDFVAKYQSLIAEIAPGPETTKKASEEKSKNKQNELASAQSRLNLCIATY